MFLPQFSFCTTCRALRFINFKTFSVWYWFRDRNLMAVILGVYGLPLTYLSVQDLPVVVGRSLGPCTFSIKENITPLFVQHCLQVYSAIPLVVYLSPLIWDVNLGICISTFQVSSTRIPFYLETAFCMTVYIIVVTLEFAPCMAWFLRLEKMVLIN